MIIFSATASSIPAFADVFEGGVTKGLANSERAFSDRWMALML